MKRLFAIAIVVLILISISLFIVLLSRTSTPQIPTPNPFHKLSYVGSIGTGTDKVEKGTRSLKQNYQKLETVSLSWYNLDSDNTITRDSSVPEETETETIAFAKENDIEVIFGISDHGEAEKADDILTDDDNQKEHFANILSIIDEKGYDGVLIDYEDMENDQEEDFTTYMRSLSQEIREKGKTLSISIPVETEGEVSHGVNIVDVSEVVDSVHMNVYEQHGAETPPGPIASFDWANTIIKNAIDQGMDPQKIVLGTAHSGHDWIVEPEEEFFKDMATDETLELLASSSAQRQWNESRKANYFRYTDDQEREHVVWVEDAASIKEKVDLAKSYQLQGIFIWYLGGEDPEVWQVLQ